MSLPLSAAHAAMPGVGSQFQLPRIHSDLEVLCHPDNEAVETLLNVDNRLYVLAQFGSEAAADIFQEMRSATWGGLCFPHTEGHKFYSVARMMVAAAMLDDCFAAPAVQASRDLAVATRDAYLAAADGTRPSDDFPAAQLLADTLPVILADISPRVGERLLDSLRHQAITSAQYHTRSVDALNIEQYLDIRWIDSCCEWLITLIEYALGIDLTDELAATPALTAARRLCGDHIVVWNDFYSFPKEIAAHDPFNSLWIFLRDEPDLQHAINQLATLCSDTERRFIAAGNQARASYPGSSDVHRYLTELGHMAAGNLQFLLLSSRYNGRGFVWDGSTPETVVIRHQTERETP